MMRLGVAAVFGLALSVTLVSANQCFYGLAPSQPASPPSVCAMYSNSSCCGFRIGDAVNYQNLMESGVQAQNASAASILSGASTSSCLQKLEEILCAPCDPESGSGGFYSETASSSETRVCLSWVESLYSACQASSLNGNAISSTYTASTFFTNLTSMANFTQSFSIINGTSSCFASSTVATSPVLQDKCWFGLPTGPQDQSFSSSFANISSSQFASSCCYEYPTFEGRNLSIAGNLQASYSNVVSAIGSRMGTDSLCYRSVKGLVYNFCNKELTSALSLQSTHKTCTANTDCSGGNSCKTAGAKELPLGATGRCFNCTGEACEAEYVFSFTSTGGLCQSMCDTVYQQCMNFPFKNESGPSTADSRVSSGTELCGLFFPGAAVTTSGCYTGKDGNVVNELPCSSSAVVNGQYCADCNSSVACGSGQKCYSGKCVASDYCAFGADCTSGVCDTVNSQCVNCVTDSDCVGANATCNTGTNVCVCPPNTAGIHCQYSDAVTCNARGVAQDTGSCTCDSGYFAAGCSKICPGGAGSAQCSGHGSCSDGESGTGICACTGGYSGTFCELKPSSASRRADPILFTSLALAVGAAALGRRAARNEH